MADAKSDRCRNTKARNRRTRCASSGSSTDRQRWLSGSPYNLDLTATNPTFPNLSGARLLSAPLWNKGTAFTEEERDRLGLHGLLPPYVETLEEQVGRAYGAYRAYDTDMGRHICLRALQDNNEVLFYRLLLDHI